MPDPIYEIISNESVAMIQGKQNETRQIVLDEIDRLNVKKSNLDTEKNNADRMILLNQSYRDRQQQYLMIMLIFLFVFGISLAIVFFQEKLGITTILMDIIIITVVGAGIFAAIFMFSDIFSRDSVDFSQLKQDGGKLINVTKKTGEDAAAANAAALSTGKLSQSVGTTCKGAECCSGPGFSWNSETKKCSG
jgi:hypothetical protein